MPPGPSPSPSEPPRTFRRLGNPLDFLEQDHRQAREICDLIDGLVRIGAVEGPAAQRIIAFLTHIFPPHLVDSDDDLHPLMRRRCPQEDGIARVLDGLEADHGALRQIIPGVIDILGTAGARTRPAPLSRSGRETLSAFSRQARRVLIVEAGIVLPIARARLGGGDLGSLRLRMLQRRGLDRVMDTP